MSIFSFVHFYSFIKTVGPGFTVDHVKLRALEDTNDVLMAQERLLTDLRESVKPLELLKAEGRGAEDMDGALSLHAHPREANVATGVKTYF